MKIRNNRMFFRLKTINFKNMWNKIIHKLPNNNSEITVLKKKVGGGLFILRFLIIPHRIRSSVFGILHPPMLTPNRV